MLNGILIYLLDSGPGVGKRHTTDILVIETYTWAEDHILNLASRRN